MPWGIDFFSLGETSSIKLARKYRTNVEDLDAKI